MLLRLSLACLLLGSAMVHASGLTSDRTRLNGVWTAVEAQRDGAAANEDIGHKLEFTEGRFTISANGKTLFSGTYSLNTSSQPAQIDFVHSEGEAKGKTWEGIYQFDGAALVICDDAFDPSRSRPAQFSAAPGSGHVLIKFRRG